VKFLVEGIFFGGRGEASVQRVGTFTFSVFFGGFSGILAILNSK
jgi:hypothetical protein